MIMRPGQALLLPASPWFIGASLVGALLLSMVTQMAFWGRAAWAPDLLALVILFWCVHQALRVGIGTAFVLGLAMDVYQGALLGQHALAYTVLAYLAVRLHRRVLWFGVWSQALHLLPLFITLHAIQWLTRGLISHQWPDGWIVLAPLIEALLWPLTDALLLAPQRRAHDPDDHRPL